MKDNKKNATIFINIEDKEINTSIYSKSNFKEIAYKIIKNSNYENFNDIFNDIYFINLVLNGCGQIEADNQILNFNTNDIIIINPEQQHSYQY